MVLTGQQLVDLCSLVGIACEPSDQFCLETPVKVLENGMIVDGEEIIYQGGKVGFLEEYPEEGSIGLDKECFL